MNNVKEHIKWLKSIGFYEDIKNVFDNDKVIIHDVYDHVYYPRTFGKCPYRFKPFIPASPIGEVWATANHISKYILWSGKNFTKKEVENNLQIFCKNVGIEYEPLETELVEFIFDCIKYWQLPEMSEYMADYCQMLDKYFKK